MNAGVRTNKCFPDNKRIDACYPCSHCDGDPGHSQISLTLNTYSHIIPSLQRDAARLMDAVFEAER